MTEKHLELVAEFMNLIDSLKHMMSNIEYMDLCNTAQTAYHLIKYQPAKDFHMNIDGVIITNRTWRHRKRNFYTEIQSLMHANQTNQLLTKGMSSSKVR